MSTSVKTHIKHPTDPLDRIIIEGNIRIKSVIIEKDVNLLLLILNNGKIIKSHLSDYPRLKKASRQKLSNWRLVSKGIGISWEELDEDLSLKGFIKSAAINTAIHNLQTDESELAVI